jgi:hypothetical protein
MQIEKERVYAYFPFHIGFLFSAKALGPSIASSLA